MGETPPGNEPVLFAPGYLSTGLNELNTAFTPDGNELFYSYQIGRRYILVHTEQREGTWQTPRLASFATPHSDVDPHISPDGRRIHYISLRPRPGESRERKDFDIWMVERTETGWGKPQWLPEPINTDKDELYPSVTGGGALYFSRNGTDSLGRMDLYRGTSAGGAWAVEHLGSPLNSAMSENNAVISPDESYLVYSGTREGHQGAELFVSYRSSNGFTEPARLPFSSEAFEYCPIFSPDGRYLFFTSFRSIGDVPARFRSPDGLEHMLTAPGNGQGDIYWVSTESFSTPPL